MQLNPSEISELIKSRIESFDTTVEARTEGTVVSLTDGILRIHGLAEPRARFCRCRGAGRVRPPVRG